ncbi:MAG: NigD-like protein [Mediterranea sp.]|jgi:hypothetical protein|nr:NigD-like protein [Mediterranea sp.]
MKRNIIYFIACLLSVVSTASLQSCLDLNNENDTAYMIIGTVRGVQEKAYYIIGDNGETFYLGDTTSVRHYKPTDGQRVFLQYIPLEESVEGYDVNARYIRIENILTKPIIPLTVETADSIGNDRINAVHMWIAGNCLNIRYQFYGSSHPEKRHMLNLVINAIAPTDNDYVTVEFRHNAFDDAPVGIFEGMVSFKLDAVAEQLKSKKGIKVVVNTLYDGTTATTVELKKEEVATLSAVAK